MIKTVLAIAMAQADPAAAERGMDILLIASSFFLLLAIMLLTLLCRQKKWLTIKQAVTIYVLSVLFLAGDIIALMGRPLGEAVFLIFAYGFTDFVVFVAFASYSRMKVKRKRPDKYRGAGIEDES